MAGVSETPICAPVAHDIGTAEHRNIGSQPARASAPKGDGPRGAEPRPFARTHNRVHYSAPRGEIASLYGSTGDRPPCRGGIGRPSGRRMAPRTAVRSLHGATVATYEGRGHGGQAAVGRCWPAGGGVGPVLVRAGPHQHVATMRWRAVLVALVRDHSAPPRIRSGAAAPRSLSHSREGGAPLRAHRTARIRWQRSRAERLWSFILYFGWRDLPL